MPEIYLRVCWEDGHTTEDDVINAMEDVPAEVHYTDPTAIVGVTDAMVVRAARALALECGEDHVFSQLSPLDATARIGYIESARKALAAAHHVPAALGREQP